MILIDVWSPERAGICRILLYLQLSMVRLLHMHIAFNLDDDLRAECNAVRDAG